MIMDIGQNVACHQQGSRVDNHSHRVTVDDAGHHSAKSQAWAMMVTAVSGSESLPEVQRGVCAAQGSSHSWNVLAFGKIPTFCILQYASDSSQKGV
jgi:hypothetical protein